MAVYKYIKQV